MQAYSRALQTDKKQEKGEGNLSFFLWRQEDGEVNRSVRLYNLIFPMWGIYFFALLFPVLHLFLLPANFIVDSVVLLLLFYLLKLPEKKKLYRRSIWKAWGLGFLADILAAGVLFGISETVALPFQEYSPISSLGAFLFATLGVALAGVLIYFFHIRFIWKKMDMEERQKRRLALGMAILTAPYLMYLPPL